MKIVGTLSPHWAYLKFLVKPCDRLGKLNLVTLANKCFQARLFIETNVVTIEVSV